MLFNIKNGVGQNVLLTRGGGSWLVFDGNTVYSLGITIYVC